MMPCTGLLRPAAVAAAVWMAAVGVASAQLPSEPPLAKGARTIGALLAEPGDIHIILVHGMRVADRKTWDNFRRLLCAHVPKPCQAEREQPITDRLMLQSQPPSANYFGTEVWGDDGAPIPEAERQRSHDKWYWSQPFVDHYRYRLNGRFIYVHEINYWPMLLAFKCQYIVYYEAQLVGPYKTNIDTCAEDDAASMHFAWFGKSRAAELRTLRPLSGGGPVINADLKSDILDWGITDAVLSLGTLKTLLRESVRCAFTDIAALDDATFDRRAGSNADRPADQPGDFDCQKTADAQPPTMKPGSQFAVMSHSLGAFLLMDTFLAAAGDEDPQGGQPSAQPPCQPPKPPAGQSLPEPTAPSAATAPSTSAFAAALKRYRASRSLCFVLASSGTLYFFANQFPLIELGRTQIDLAKAPGSPTFKSALELWAAIGVNEGRTKQIIAFSDPGDILTFEVPPINGATVFNVYPRNAPRWFHLFEDPVAAHVNYMTNPAVLKAVFGE